jgi:hypothetical protein
MLEINEGNFRSKFRTLEHTAAKYPKPNPGAAYSMPLNDSGYHYPELFAVWKQYGEWVVFLQVSTVIGGEPFEDSRIALCFLSHGEGAAVQSIESLGITLA